MKPKILEIIDTLNLTIDREQAEAFANAVVEECMFAFLLNYEGKINPITLKEMLDEQLGINEFYFEGKD